MNVHESPVVPDEDACLQVFREMSRWEPTAGSESPLAPRLKAGNREVVEYQGVTNSITILGEVLAPRHPRRLVRIHLRDSGQTANQHDPLDGLEIADREFLRAKGALSLPDTDIWYLLHVLPMKNPSLTASVTNFSKFTSNAFIHLRLLSIGAS